MILKAWENVRSETIAHCFKKATSRDIISGRKCLNALRKFDKNEPKKMK